MKRFSRTAPVQAAVVSVGVLLTVSACGTTAPTVAQPTPAVSTSQPSTSSPPTSSSSTFTAPPPPTSSSSSSSTTPRPTQTNLNECFTSTSGLGPTPAANTPARSFGTTVKITSGTADTSMTLKVEAPRPVSDNPSFPSTDNTRLVAIKITATLLTGTSRYVGSTSFNMFDAGGKECRRTYFSSLAPADEFRGKLLTTSDKTVTGSLVYKVPVPAATDRLVVAFNGQLRTTATVQWKG